MRRRHIFGMSAAGLFAPSVVRAQGMWPERPIRVIVPFPPGGSTDTIARILQPKLRRLLGKPVVVENRGGASGSVGATEAARAAPDGYTWLLAYDNEATNQTAMRLSYRLMQAFAPVSPGRNRAAGHGRAPEHALEDLRGRGRRGQGGAGHHQLRDLRASAASRMSRPRSCSSSATSSWSTCPTAAAAPPCRPCSPARCRCFMSNVVDHQPAHPRRHPAPARRHHPGRNAPRARREELRAAGLRGLRGADLVGPARPRRHAGADPAADGARPCSRSWPRPRSAPASRSRARTWRPAGRSAAAASSTPKSSKWGQVIRDNNITLES